MFRLAAIVMQITPLFDGHEKTAPNFDRSYLPVLRRHGLPEGYATKRAEPKNLPCHLPRMPWQRPNWKAAFKR
jgi:hypothetical protein